MNITKKYKSLIKLIIALFLFFYASIITIIPIVIFNIDLDTASTTTIYALQLFSNIFRALCLFLMYKKELIEKFKEFKNNFWDNADTAIKYWMIGLVVMAASNILIGIFTPSKVANNEAGVQEIITQSPLIAFILTTILAPFTEEVIFRKSFRDVFKEKNIYILISGLVFGSLHVISSVTTLYDYLYIIPYSALGIAFATIYYKTDNIFSSIFVHMLHNGVLTIMSIISTGMMLL